MNALPIVTSSRRRRRDALGKALPMFKEEWIRDHLLGKAPTIDASIISSPLQQLHTISFESVLNFDPIDHERIGDNMGLMVSSESVMVPAYSRDGLNLGFCLSETAGLSSNNFFECHYGSSVRNFVFREDNGLFMAVARNSQSEILMLLSANEMRRERTFSCFVFPGKSFSTLIEHGVDDPASFERILYTSISTKFLRQCPFCGANFGIACDCDLRFRNSKMPLDLSAIAKNISMTQLGNGVGNGLFEVLSNGVPVVSIPVNSTNRTSNVVKQGRAKRFVQRAVADVLKNTPAEVQRAIAAPLNDDIVRMTALTNSDEASDDYKQQTPNSAKVDTTTTVFANHDKPLNRSHHTFQPSNQIRNIADCTVREARRTITENVPSLTFPSLMAHNSASVHVTDFGKVPTASTSHFESSLIQTTNLVPTIAKGVAHGKLCTTPPIAPRNIAPTGALHHAVPPMSDEAKMKKLAKEVREWRAYQRKLRNRASARRSNLVKKQRLRNERARRNQQNEYHESAV